MLNMTGLRLDGKEVLVLYVNGKKAYEKSSGQKLKLTSTSGQTYEFSYAEVPNPFEFSGYNAVTQEPFIEIEDLDQPSKLMAIDDQAGQITSLNEFAFNYCMSLSSANLPAVIETVGSDTFNQCFNLSSVSLPSLTGVVNFTFDHCGALTAVDAANAVRLYANAFNGSPNLKILVLSAYQGVTIADYTSFAYHTTDYKVSCIVPDSQYGNYMNDDRWQFLTSDCVEIVKLSEYVQS